MKCPFTLRSDKGVTKGSPCIEKECPLWIDEMTMVHLYPVKFKFTIKAHCGLPGGNR
jgi:hypothetical protein